MPIGQGEKVLVVEDDEIVRRVLTQVLAKDGIECDCATTCAEARNLAEQNPYDCALVDLGLPDGRGLQLLPHFRQHNPWLVPVILTGDGRSETILETLRAGAFDFLLKPVEAVILRATVARALEHHRAIHERDRLVALLRNEREQLQQRVTEATAELRQYAANIEQTSARLRSLVRLSQVSEEFYTDDMLMRSVFEEIGKSLPLRCVLLMSPGETEVLCAFQNDDGELVVASSDSAATEPDAAAGAARRDPRTAALDWLEQETDLEHAELQPFIYPQLFWGRTLCTVTFLLPVDFESDDSCEEFLSMAARFMAAEWQEARMLLHATQQASLGNIALELSRGFIQRLTAIRTAADVLAETDIPPDASEGLRILNDNVEILRRKLQEFRQLTSPRRDSIETVQLDRHIDQALEMLSMAIQVRGITIEKDYQGECECVLFNGATLARTFLDLISSAVRTVPASGRVLLRLLNPDPKSIVFEISHDQNSSELFWVARTNSEQSLPEMLETHPRFLLAQRTVQSCGGKLVLKHEREGKCAFRIILPKNALNLRSARETVA